MEHFSYKGVCGVCECTRIKALKRRASLGYRWTASGYVLINVYKDNLSTIRVRTCWPVTRYVCDCYCYIWISDV